MEMVAHNPKMAKKVGIPQSVGKEFVAADKGKKFGTGGGVGVTRGGKGMINRQETRFGSVLGQEKNVPNVNLNKYVGKKTGGKVKKKMMATKKFSQKETMGSESMGKVKTGAPSIDGIAERGKTKTKYPKMAGNTIGNGPLVHCK